jgi:hypothetical protein
VVVAADGAIRGWAVRGAAGDLKLQVIRHQARGWVAASSSPFQHVVNRGFRRLPADLAVRRGDRIGLELAPGATIGFGRAPGRTARFVAALQAYARAPDPRTPAALQHELMLRVDIVPDARVAEPRPLTGAAAAAAPAGRVLARAEIEVADRPRTLAVVRLDGAVHVDLFAGGRRISRVAVAGADPRGALVKLDAFSYDNPDVSWRNPDGAMIEHSYVVAPDSLRAEN